MMSEKECAEQLKREIADYQLTYDVGYTEGFETCRKKAIKLLEYINMPRRCREEAQEAILLMNKTEIEK